MLARLFLLLLRAALPLVVGLVVMAWADDARAQCCDPPPPPCCDPPDPPCCDPPDPPEPPPPPETPCCLNVHVTVDVEAEATADARARVNGFALNDGRGRGYGSGFVSVTQPAPTVISNLTVEGARRVAAVPYTMRRRVERRVMIQAVCIDARSIPHPAARLRPEEDVLADFEGELYRCVAGSHLQITLADYEAGRSFNGGETLVCGRLEALYHTRGGGLECRPQTAERDCFERSLLRRHGAGIKILTLVREEEYVEYREEVVVETVSGLSLVLDGGVGGRVH